MREGDALGGGMRSWRGPLLFHLVRSSLFGPADFTRGKGSACKGASIWRSCHATRSNDTAGVALVLLRLPCSVPCPSSICLSLPRALLPSKSSTSAV
jgi:hypothetical protein